MISHFEPWPDTVYDVLHGGRTGDWNRSHWAAHNGLANLASQSISSSVDDEAMSPAQRQLLSPRRLQQDAATASSAVTASSTTAGAVERSGEGRTAYGGTQSGSSGTGYAVGNPASGYGPPTNGASTNGALTVSNGALADGSMKGITPTTNGARPVGTVTDSVGRLIGNSVDGSSAGLTYGSNGSGNIGANSLGPAGQRINGFKSDSSIGNISCGSSSRSSGSSSGTAPIRGRGNAVGTAATAGPTLNLMLNPNPDLNPDPDSDDSFSPSQTIPIQQSSNSQQAPPAPGRHVEWAGAAAANPVAADKISVEPQHPPPGTSYGRLYASLQQEQESRQVKHNTCFLQGACRHLSKQ